MKYLKSGIIGAITGHLVSLFGIKYWSNQKKKDVRDNLSEKQIELIYKNATKFNIINGLAMLVPFVLIIVAIPVIRDVIAPALPSLLSGSNGVVLFIKIIVLGFISLSFIYAILVKILFPIAFRKNLSLLIKYQRVPNTDRALPKVDENGEPVERDTRWFGDEIVESGLVGWITFKSLFFHILLFVIIAII